MIATMISSEVFVTHLMDFFWEHLNDRAAEAQAISGGGSRKLEFVGRQLRIMFDAVDTHARAIEGEVVKHVIATAMKRSESDTILVTEMLRPLQGASCVGEGKGADDDDASPDKKVDPFLNMSLASIRQMMQMQFGAVFGIAQGDDDAAVKVGANLVQQVREIKMFDPELCREGSEAATSCGKLFVSVLEWAVCRAAYCSVPMTADWSLVTGEEVAYDPIKYDCMDMDPGPEAGVMCVVMFPPVCAGDTVVVKGQVIQEEQVAE
jgi:hypothetical protein